MEGLIPFVIDAIRKSHARDSYRCASSDGSSHGGSGSRRHLIDYRELPAGAADADAIRHQGPWSEFIQAPADVRPSEEHARPAAAVAGSAYRWK
ncbi:hypothetical protein CFC21_028969 [Triticum aestivum]|uniref:Uncharacterized protein n=3 Tax=Triticinae TaxID=1648030 RepID=A0A3B6DD97_WHEAT|nr:uncharacterized protein LOC109784088 [Aegilops tauschii subsp. strangulata]KAF7015053.1 hypothetical protein CFC21_028969 [Triticum aestivum]